MLPRQGPNRPRHPLISHTAHVIRVWLAEHHGEPSSPLFPQYLYTSPSKKSLTSLMVKVNAIARHRPPGRDPSRKAVATTLTTACSVRRRRVNNQLGKYSPARSFSLDAPQNLLVRVGRDA